MFRYTRTRSALFGERSRHQSAKRDPILLVAFLATPQICPLWAASPRPLHYTSNSVLPIRPGFSASSQNGWNLVRGTRSSISAPAPGSSPLVSPHTLDGSSVSIRNRLCSVLQDRPPLAHESISL